MWFTIKKVYDDNNLFSIIRVKSSQGIQGNVSKLGGKIQEHKEIEKW